MKQEQIKSIRRTIYYARKSILSTFEQSHFHLKIFLKKFIIAFNFYICFGIRAKLCIGNVIFDLATQIASNRNRVTSANNSCVAHVAKSVLIILSLMTNFCNKNFAIYLVTYLSYINLLHFVLLIFCVHEHSPNL